MTGSAKIFRRIGVFCDFQHLVVLPRKVAADVIREIAYAVCVAENELGNLGCRVTRN